MIDDPKEKVQAAYEQLLDSLASSRRYPRRLMRDYSYAFPEAALAPGEERTVETDVDFQSLGNFRPQKLIVVGLMAEERGHFKIAHTRIPLLNREQVIAYSDLKTERTTVEYREGAVGNFVRSYLPENVKYIHTDPLSYIVIKQIYCGMEPQMMGDVSAKFFAAGCFGNSLSMSSGVDKISLVLKNVGDIQVRVYAVVFGVIG